MAFADLVGFTQLGEALPAEELERVASRLGDLARDVVEAPVRFIKTIGDAVMFVCPDPLALLNAVLDLMEAAAGEEYPRLRAGIAFGSAVNRAGDWFGSPVNVASPSLAWRVRRLSWSLCRYTPLSGTPTLLRGPSPVPAIFVDCRARCGISHAARRRLIVKSRIVIFG